MNQNAYQILCMCQNKLVRRFQRIYAKHFNVNNQKKSMFATICNTYCIIQCKIQTICYINSQKLIIFSHVRRESVKVHTRQTLRSTLTLKIIKVSVPLHTLQESSHTHPE